jgi:hypothetical protein
MRNVSEHTLQLNLWISLCQVDPQFPGNLRRAGYVVDIIDPDFVHDGEPVNPDIILTSSSRNHSVVVDCKSWMLKEHQNNRYENLVDSPGVLTSQGIVTGVSPETFDIDFGYSSYNDLTENEHLPDNNFAVVHFDDGSVLVVDTVAGRGFDESSLSDCFPIELGEDDRIPTDYYPFDPGISGDEEQMIISVLQETVHLALGQQSFTADEILNGAHPFWIDWDDDKRQEARSRVESIVNEYSKQGLSEHIEKVQRSDPPEWRVVSKSLQALQRKASDFIEETKTILEQRRLEEFEKDDTEGSDDDSD